MNDSRAWSWGAGLVSLIVLGAGLMPALLPWWTVWQFPERDVPRWFGLATNSGLLALGTVALAVPLGALTGLLLAKTDLPALRVWHAALMISLVLPLPVLAGAWLALASALGLPRTGLPAPLPLLLAIVAHAAHALPWVVLVTLAAVVWLDADLEEEARLHAPPGRVLTWVLLPRLTPALGLAALVVALQTWHEITVTDLLQVRTLGEEVYLQFAGGGPGAQAAALQAVAPVGIAVFALVYAGLHFWRTWCGGEGQRRSSWRLPLGRWRALAVLWLSLVLVLPLLFTAGVFLSRVGQVYATAEQPGPAVWSSQAAWLRLGQACWRQSGVLLDTLAVAVLTAGATLLLTAAVLLWGQRLRWLDRLVWLVAAVILATPGPILGLGLLDVLVRLQDLHGGWLWGMLLYHQPSPLANAWSATLRSWPLALALAWPLAHRLPRAWMELARLDGAGPLATFRLTLAPALRGPLLAAAWGAAVLSLGDLAAGKLVTPPGFTPLVQHCFQQLHAGADAEVAALALLLLALATLGSLPLTWWLSHSTLLSPKNADA